MNDMIVSSSDMVGITSTKEFLHDCLNIHDLGALMYFLSIEFICHSSEIILN